MSEPIRSRALYERALQVMPGGNSRTTVFTPPFPLYAAYGRGCVVVDVEGREHLDFVNNQTSLIHGHAHPAIVEAIAAQAARGTAFAMPTEAEIELAEILLARLPTVEHLRFANSGTEAVMMAVKAARAFTGRPKIAKFEGCYHGSYDYVETSLTPAPAEWGPDGEPRAVAGARGTPPGVLEDVVVLPFNDREACQQLIERHAPELAAVVVDPLPSHLGMIRPQPGFLPFLREVTRASNVLLISDEVMSFRIGYHGAHGVFDFRPDLLCLAKIIGGGLPVGAVAGSAEVMAVFDPRGSGPAVPHGGTFNANPLTMAAGRAAMQLLTPEAMDRLNALGDRLRQRVNAAFETVGVPGQMTGAGSLSRLHTFSRPVTDYRSGRTNAREREAFARIYAHLTAHGIWLSKNGLVCLSTPMTEAEVDTFADVLTDALREEATRGR